MYCMYVYANGDQGVGVTYETNTDSYSIPFAPFVHWDLYSYPCALSTVHLSPHTHSLSLSLSLSHTHTNRVIKKHTIQRGI